MTERPLEKSISTAITMLFEYAEHPAATGICCMLRPAWCSIVEHWTRESLLAAQGLTSYLGGCLGENWDICSRRLGKYHTRRGVLLRVGYLMLVRRALRDTDPFIRPALDADPRT